MLLFDPRYSPCVTKALSGFSVRNLLNHYIDFTF